MTNDVEDTADTTGRLGADDFVSAAFDIMADDGIDGVKITRLCDRLGVTKGSFYWHFADIDAFHGEVARRWAESGARLPDEAEVGDSVTDMLTAMTLFAEPRNSRLARTMREWAQTDDRARDAIHAADEALYARVQAAFESLGFGPDDAAVRAKILIYAGHGFAAIGPLGGGRRGRDDIRATWDLLSRR